MTKTVYFLGAGFSKSAGGPIQNEIIQTIFTPGFADAYKHNDDITKGLNDFKEFLLKDLNILDSNFQKIALEDVFTPIDRCIADGKSFRSQSTNQLVALRERLHTLMGASIQYQVDLQIHKDAYIQEFANYINTIAKNRIKYPEQDAISIISTNWDILLDNRLHEAIESNTEPELAVVDYCCYISSLENDDKIKPGLYALGKGGYNIKYLKLHGSLNWLHCPMCQRMYIKFNEKTMLSDSKYYCKHCKSNYGLGNIAAIKLKGNLLLPTFLKDLSNVQIKLVWQNAGVELSEASNIVFIGYSLPAADFEIRQLLSRSIRNNATINVVVFPEDTHKDELIDRYKNFFGSRAIEIIEKKVPDYIQEICGKSTN